MNQTISLSNYRLNEYLGVLNPSREVTACIWSLKYEFVGKEGAELAIRTAPHLTVINFVASPTWEEKIANRLRLISMGITPFNVELENFGTFERSRALFINVVSKDPIRYLVQELKQAEPLLHLYKSYPPLFISDPHVSICRGMLPEQYQTSSVKYSTRQFDANFTASSMTLLKRPLGEFKCDAIGNFVFQSKPQLPRQGSLFM